MPTRGKIVPVAYEDPRTDKKEAAYLRKVRGALDDMGAPNSGELVHNSSTYIQGVFRAGIAPEMAASVIWHQHCQKAGSQTVPCVAELGAGCPVVAPSAVPAANCPPEPPRAESIFARNTNELVITTFDGLQFVLPSSMDAAKAHAEANFILGRGYVQLGACPVRVQKVEVRPIVIPPTEPLEARDSFGAAENCVPVMKLVRDEASLEACRELFSRPFETDADMFEFLSEKMGQEDQEIFVVVAMDLNRMARGYVEIARGQIDGVTVDPVDVMRVVLLSNCHGFVIAHNHPSGYADPSPKDRLLTEGIRAAARPYEAGGKCRFIDHIVVGKDEWFSFADNKLKKKR